MTKLDYYNFSGGMNTKTSPLILKDNECELIINYNLDIVGALTKRRGMTNVVAQIVNNQNILGLYFFKDSQGTDYSNILATCNDGTPGTNTDTYKFNGGIWSKSLEDDTLSVNQFFFTFLDSVFRVNGVQKVSVSADLITWTNVDTPDTTVPDLKPKYGCVWEDRVYVAHENGTTKQPSRIYWSSLPSSGDITWAITTDFTDINPDDNDFITWIEPFGNKLLIFKNYGMYRWTFGQVEPDKIIDVGTPEGRTVKQLHGLCFWTNKDGVYIYSEGMPKLISRKVQKWFDAAVSNTSSFRAEVDEDHYYVFIGDVTVDRIAYTNILMCYTISLDAWHIEQYPLPFKAMVKARAGTYGGITLTDSIYFGDNDGGFWKLHHTDSSNVNLDLTDASAGTHNPIEGKILTKEYPLANFPKTSILKMLYFFSGLPTGTKVNYRIDRGEWKPWKDLQSRITEGGLSGRARTIQFSITDNSRVMSQIEGFSIELEPEKGKLRKENNEND